jgi:cyclopropane-fatty-acyl-phospholipid synthase
MTAISPPVCLRQPVLRPMCLRAAVARRVLESVARRVPADVVMPDGRLLGRGGASARTQDRPVLEVVRPQALFERLAHHPKIGIGEAYTAGEWRAGKDTDLADLLLPFAERLTTLVPPALARLRRVVDRPIPQSQRNSVARARGNIEAHYDLGNDLFAAFLDETLSYSAARFDDARPWSAQRLEDAQLRKVDAVLDLAHVRRGSRILEIGTGWGTLAIEAARRGARVTSLTLSPAQASAARDRITAAGLADAIDVQLMDYR